jgi:hypothetical protein
MPTREYKRAWCKKCNDWELFEQHYPNWQDWFCKECETQHEKIPFSEIPEKKLIEQRKRYIEWNRRESGNFMKGLFMSAEEKNMKELIHMFSPPGEDIEISESDVGQHAIDDEVRRKRVEKI